MAKTVSTQYNPNENNQNEEFTGIDKIFIIDASYRPDLNDTVILLVKFIEKGNLEKKIIFPKDDLLKCFNIPNATNEELNDFCNKIKGRTINIIVKNVMGENISPDVTEKNIDEKIEQSDSSVLSAAFNLAKENENKI